MLIDTITGVATRTTKFRSIAKHIEVQIAKSTAINTTSPTAKIYTYNPTGGKRNNITEVSPIIDLAEFNSMDLESSIVMYGTMTITADGNASVSVYTEVLTLAIMRIDLVEEFEQGLALEGDDEGVIEFAGLDTGATYTIYTIDAKQKSSKHVSYQLLSTDNTKNRRFGCDGVNAIGIERGAGLVNITIKYKNGYVLDILPTEMDSRTMDKHGLVYVRRKLAASSLYLSDVNPLTERIFVVELYGEAEYVQVNNDGVALKVYLKYNVVNDARVAA